MKKQKRKIVIIGSGPAGLTAGIYTARASLAPLIIDGSKPGGQLMTTSIVENWPGIKSILGPDLMQNMRKHAEDFGSTFLTESVTRVDFARKPFTLWTDRDTILLANAVIIATGASPNKLNCPGEDIYWGKGVTTCAVCDGAFYPDKDVLIIGGGDTAMEEASFMTKFTDKITIIQNQGTLTASHIMQQRVLDNPKIKIIYNSTVTEFKGDGSHVTHAVIKNAKTGKTITLKADGIFLAIGMHPNTDIFKNQLELGDWGYLKLNKKTHTSVQGIFAAGDVADWQYKQAITSAGSGCMAALDAERYLGTS